MSGVMETLQLRQRQAVDDELAYEEFLYRLLHDELERREAKQLQSRMRRANFEHDKTLEDFDFSFNPEIPKNKVIDLATCNFVEMKRNAILIGKTGVGKSHVAQAIGHRACVAGYSTVYNTASTMMSTLRASRADDSYERKLAQLFSPDLLIIDDLGLTPLQGEAPLDLYEVIRHRYERGSIIITSNRDVEELYPLFPDKLLASAAMDRLLDDAIIITMKGDTYRNSSRAKKARRKEDNN
jgi:DNA replication protein DnaC